jgi:hypothetical protein
MRRREFIKLLGSAAAFMATRGAQQTGRVWRVAVIPRGRARPASGRQTAHQRRKPPGFVVRQGNALGSMMMQAAATMPRRKRATSINSPPSKMAERYRAQVFSLALLERAVAGRRSHTPQNKTACSKSDARHVAISLGSDRTSVALRRPRRCARRASMKAALFADLGTQSRFPLRYESTKSYCGFCG